MDKNKVHDTERDEMFRHLSVWYHLKRLVQLLAISANTVDVEGVHSHHFFQSLSASLHGKR